MPNFFLSQLGTVKVNRIKNRGFEINRSMTRVIEAIEINCLNDKIPLYF